MDFERGAEIFVCCGELITAIAASFKLFFDVYCIDLVSKMILMKVLSKLFSILSSKCCLQYVKLNANLVIRNIMVLPAARSRFESSECKPSFL